MLLFTNQYKSPFTTETIVRWYYIRIIKSRFRSPPTLRIIFWLFFFPFSLLFYYSFNNSVIEYCFLIYFVQSPLFIKMKNYYLIRQKEIPIILFNRGSTTEHNMKQNLKSITIGVIVYLILLYSGIFLTILELSK